MEKRLWKPVTEKLPTRDECIEILKNSGCSDQVIAHCRAVEGIAVNIAKRAHCDMDMVSIGALLHDIGRARTHGIKHAVEGGNLARELGLPERIILIIERHIGAGISKDEALDLGLPGRDYIPATLEEKIVAHADNLIRENKKRPVEDIVKQFQSRGYLEAAGKIATLHKELSEICKIDLDLI
jgi:uncharacterized protein (TIGR00295 family)